MAAIDTTLEVHWFPVASAYDRKDSMISNVDPLGLATNADRIAALLLPDVMNRMARARLLTLTVVAAEISARAVPSSDTKNREVLAAHRLAFERLVVTGLVSAFDRQETRSLPGQRLARRARSANEPLTPANYLSAAEVNAPSGVYATLARGAGLIEEREFVPTILGQRLLTAWHESECKSGIFAHDENSSLDKWLNSMASRAQSLVADPSGAWPKANSNLWRQLGNAFALDVLRKRGATDREVLLLREVLAASEHTNLAQRGARRRMLTLLQKVKRAHLLKSQTFQRSLLQQGIRPYLGDNLVDRRLRAAIDLLEATEPLAAVLEAMFYRLCAQAKASGMTTASVALKNEAFAKAWKSLWNRLKQLHSRFMSTIASAEIVEAIDVSGEQILRDLWELRSDVDLILTREGAGIEPLLARHARVQESRQRGVWVSLQSGRIALRRGRDEYTIRATPTLDYPHPLRLNSMVSLMADLKLTAAVADSSGDAD